MREVKNKDKYEREKEIRINIMMFIICLQKNFKIYIDKMIFLVYNRGGWAGIDNNNKYII